jgi:hypothetical protein
VALFLLLTNPVFFLRTCHFFIHEFILNSKVMYTFTQHTLQVGVNSIGLQKDSAQAVEVVAASNPQSLVVAFIPTLPLGQSNGLIELMSTDAKEWEPIPTSSTTVFHYSLHLMISKATGERLGYLDTTADGNVIISPNPLLWNITENEGVYFLAHAMGGFLGISMDKQLVLSMAPWNDRAWKKGFLWTFNPLAIQPQPLPPTHRPEFQRLPSGDVPHVVHNSAYLDYLQGISNGHNGYYVAPYSRRPQTIATPRKYVDRQQQAAHGNHNYYSNPEQILRARATAHENHNDDQGVSWIIWCLIALLLSVLVCTFLQRCLACRAPA